MHMKKWILSMGVLFMLYGCLVGQLDTVFRLYEDC